MKLFLNWKMRFAFGLAMMALLLMGAVSYRWMIVSDGSNGWVKHTHDVLMSIQDMRLAMKTAQSSSLDFALTGDDADIGFYHTNVLRVVRDEEVIRKLTVDNPLQQSRIPTLEALAVENFRRTAAMIALRQDKGLMAVAATSDGAIQQSAVAFEGEAGKLREEELRLRALRTATTETDISQIKDMLIFGTYLGMLFVGTAAWSVENEISRRAQADAALRESEERLRFLLDGVRDHAIFMLDTEGQVVSWNAGAERIKGYTAQEIVGQSFARFFPQDDRDKGRPQEILRMAAASGHFEESAMRVRKDGTEFLASVSNSALRDPAGNLRGFSVISHDLTANQQSEARYRGLLEAAPDAMVVVNERGEIVLLNAQAEKQFGYRRDELLEQIVTNIIPAGFAERLIADGTRTAAEALAQQIGTGIELIGQRKDGSEFPIEIMLSPLDSAEGILVTAAIRDITVRKDAEKHLAQMEGRYRGLLEAAPDGMVVVNERGEIVLLNAQAEKHFGYRRDELIGQKVTNIIPVGFAERLIADGTRTAAEALAQQIGTGIELNGRRKDGSEFPIEIMLSPLESAEGILVTAAIRDITVRKDAETHLAQMEGRYRGLLEAAPDGMVVVNERGEIVLLNAQSEKQFGYLRNELIGQEVKSIIPEGFAERLIADGTRTAAEALAQHIGTGIELYGLRKDGSEFPIEIMLSPLESVEGILVTAAIRDITTRKEAEAHLVQNVKELNRSNEELEQFAYVASHDLQEPLRMVASYTQLLSRRYKGKLDSDADDFIAFAVDGANRMQRLIQDLLTFSRVGKKGQDLLDISSDDALQQAILNLRGAIEDSGAIVTHGLMPEVKANEIQLTQLFQNLVGNAIKYQGPGIPHIHISAAKNGAPRWIFSVKDDGLGIDPQFFERIFGMFQRLHKRDEFAGTGMGLAICRKIVERHGGSISVESIPGEGSTFHFTLAESERKS